MNNKILKETANTLSDIYLKNEDDFLKAYRECTEITTARDGYIIGQLCDVYREAKTGLIDRDTTLKRQQAIFAEGDMLV